MDWDNKYSLGIKDIDDQHKNLFNRLKQLQASLDTGMNPREIGLTLKTLVEYSQTHFSDEEKFMETIRFPEKTNHANLHKLLIGEIRGLLLKLKTSTASAKVKHRIKLHRFWIYLLVSIRA